MSDNPQTFTTSASETAHNRRLIGQLVPEVVRLRTRVEELEAELGTALLELQLLRAARKQADEPTFGWLFRTE